MSSLTFHSIAIAPAITALQNAHAYISKGHKHALANNIDPETYLTASLHPDMKDFRFQIYRATDAVKFMPSRINPSLENVTFPDEEMTFEELLARLDKTVKYLEKFSVSDFEGKEGSEVVIKMAAIKKQIRMPALEYVTKFAHPNMWFHLVTAYDILRMKGVDVGKFDYLNGSNVFEQEDMQE